MGCGYVAHVGMFRSVDGSAKMKGNVIKFQRGQCDECWKMREVAVFILMQLCGQCIKAMYEKTEHRLRPVAEEKQI